MSSFMNNTHTSFPKVWQIASYKSIVGDVNGSSITFAYNVNASRFTFVEMLVR